MYILCGKLIWIEAIFVFGVVGNGFWCVTLAKYSYNVLCNQGRAGVVSYINSFWFCISDSSGILFYVIRE